MPIAPVTVEIALLNPSKDNPDESIFITKNVKLPLNPTAEAWSMLRHWIINMQQYVMVLEDSIEVGKKLISEARKRDAQFRRKKVVDKSIVDLVSPDPFKRIIVNYDNEINEELKRLRQAKADLRRLIAERKRILVALNGNAALKQHTTNLMCERGLVESTRT